MTSTSISSAVLPGENHAGSAVAVAARDPVVRDRAASALADAGLPVVAIGATSSDWTTSQLVDVGVAVMCADIAVAHEGAELGRLKSELGAVKMVVVSPSPRPIGVRRLLAAGIEGVVLEEAVGPTLAPTVRAVLADQIVVPSAARKQLERPALTLRERQVLGLVTLGFANGEIAGKLFLAESTVKSHLSSGFAKLGVRSRSEAAALILDPSDTLDKGILTVTGAQYSDPPSALQ